MAQLKSVIDLLAEQPEDLLIRMRDNIRTELARLKVEAEQVEQALAKKSRRVSRSGSSSAGSGGRLTRQQVFEVVVRAARPVTPAEVVTLLEEQGHGDVTVNAVRNHLMRLVEQNKWLERADGRFSVASETITSGLEGESTEGKALLL